jgi:hypothetical protein
MRTPCINVTNRGLDCIHIHGLGGRMEMLVLMSRAISLSVIFYVVAYFLMTWQWPHSLLSIFLATFFVCLFFKKGTNHPDQNPLTDFLL